MTYVIITQRILEAPGIVLDKEYNLEVFNSKEGAENFAKNLIKNNGGEYTIAKLLK